MHIILYTSIGIEFQYNFNLTLSLCPMWAQITNEIPILGQFVSSYNISDSASSRASRTMAADMRYAKYHPKHLETHAKQKEQQKARRSSA